MHWLTLTFAILAAACALVATILFVVAVTSPIDEEHE